MNLKKLAVTLEHQYTPEGLSIGNLKGVDQARADVLLRAAEQAGCIAHLALITHWQSGSAEGGDYGYSSGRGRYRSWSYEEAEDPDEGTGHEMGEVFDETLSINHWSDREGNKIAFGEMGLDLAEIVSDCPPDDWDLGHEEFEGFTGNAGMTLERWYHRAAVVIWPAEKNFEVLCGAGTDAAISGLKKMIAQLKLARASDQQEQRASCVKFASAIITTWAPHRVSHHSYLSNNKLDRSEFSLSLQELDDPELMNRFLTQIVAREGDIGLGKSFPTFCKRHGWTTFQDSLTAVIDAASSATVARNAALLETLCVQRDKNADRKKVCTHLAHHAVTALENLDTKRSVRDWVADRIDRAALLGSLIKSLISADAAESLNRLFDHTLSHDQIYDLTNAHLAAIFTLESYLSRKGSEIDGVVNRWLTHCRGELEKRTEHAPTPPAIFDAPTSSRASAPIAAS